MTVRCSLRSFHFQSFPFSSENKVDDDAETQEPMAAEHEFSDLKWVMIGSGTLHDFRPMQGSFSHKTSLLTCEAQKLVHELELLVRSSRPSIDRVVYGFWNQVPHKKPRAIFHSRHSCRAQAKDTILRTHFTDLQPYN